MEKAYSKGEAIQLEGLHIAETSFYAYRRRSKAAWAAFGPLREATDHLTDLELCAYLFDTTVLSALCYAAET